MKPLLLPSLCLLILSLSVVPSFSQWPPAQATAIPEADGFAVIPNVAVPPKPGQLYRAVFDATHAAKDPAQILPALNMAGSELNAFAAMGLPLKNARFAVVFHGAALHGISNDSLYRQKFGVSNPNLPVLRKMKEAGVELFVCGQNLAADNIDPNTLSPDVTVASDALIVLIEYQNKGYALLSY